MKRATGGARIVIAAVSLLVLGATAGIAADRAMHWQRTPSSVAATAHEALAALDRAANLRPEQRERIDSILAARQSDIDAAWRDARAHVERTVNAVITEIEGVLDAEQIPPFRALVEQIHGPDGLQLHH